MNAKLTRVIIKQETQVIRFKQMFLSFYCESATFKIFVFTGKPAFPLISASIPAAQQPNKELKKKMPLLGSVLTKTLSVLSDFLLN